MTGPDSKNVIIRAIGPSLAAYSVPDVLQDPTLELHDSTGATIAFDDNWQDSQASEVQATGLASRDGRESAIVKSLSPGGCTAIVRGKGSSTENALVEVYDLAPDSNAKLAKTSTRGFVMTFVIPNWTTAPTQR